MQYADVEKHRGTYRSLVIEEHVRKHFQRLTFDFDGSVITTKGHAEGTAIVFNKAR
jgi:hypothetical protein